MGKFRILISLLALAIFVSCDKGRVDCTKVPDLAKDMPILVTITVNINLNRDPELYIRAKEIEINRDKKELTIVGQALITNVGGPWYTQRDSLAIKIENSKFSLPLGGKITIYKDGKTEVLEQY